MLVETGGIRLTRRRKSFRNMIVPGQILFVERQLAKHSAGKRRSGRAGHSQLQPTKADGRAETGRCTSTRVCVS